MISMQLTKSIFTDIAMPVFIERLHEDHGQKVEVGRCVHAMLCFISDGISASVLLLLCYYSGKHVIKQKKRMHHRLKKKQAKRLQELTNSNAGLSNP